MTTRTPRLPAPERRRRLLDAALEVVDERGFHGLTVEAVARRAGVTRPVVYDLFGDLQRLLLALAEREEAAALATLAAVVPVDPAGREPDALLAGAIEAFLRAVRAAPRTWRLVLRPPDGTPPVLRERIATSRRRLAAQVAELLGWGLAARGGPRGLDREVLARLLIAAAEDAARLSLAHPRRFPPARLATAARGMLALLPPEAA
jgi:AcrR family transcriptional regulator